MFIRLEKHHDKPPTWWKCSWLSSDYHPLIFSGNWCENELTIPNMHEEFFNLLQQAHEHHTKWSIEVSGEDRKQASNSIEEAKWAVGSELFPTRQNPPCDVIITFRLCLALLGS